MRKFEILIFLILICLLVQDTCGWAWCRRRRRCSGVNCQWHWGGCSRTCGGGLQYPVKTRNEYCGGSCSMPSGPRRCNAHCCPVNCFWKNWNHWSSCSQTCGTGTRTRIRGNVAPRCGGRQCYGSSRESQSCNRRCCPVHCSWEAWKSWETCSVPCGGGIQSRSRNIGTQSQCGGNSCNGNSKESRSCNSGCCPINCQWGPWESWGACSATCGDSFQSRLRRIGVKKRCGGNVCVGEAEQIRSCASKCCPLNCEWGSWESWGTCSVTCAGGTQLRQRAVAVKEQCGGSVCEGDNNETQSCNTDCCPVACEWNEWSAWSTCSQTCGEGRQSRERSKSLEESCGGQCEGSTSEERQCNDICCPIDCQLGEWSEWGNCSRSCDWGYHNRTRTTTTQASCGGEPCKETSSTEEKSCNLFCCSESCHWHEWTEWSSCSRTCGIAEQVRRRKVDIEEGCQTKYCPGIISEERNCYQKCCPVNCKVSEWTQWSNCSSTCGGNGVRSRSRFVTQEMQCDGDPCPGNLHEVEDCGRLCYNGVVHEDGKCHCIDGWSGNCCEQDINECDQDRRQKEMIFESGSGRGGEEDYSRSVGIRPLHCDVNARCTNTPGGYSCSCLKGFSGDGISCDDIDECELDLEYKQQMFQSQRGFGSGSGSVEESVSQYCHEHAYCKNTHGGYYCTCMDGYSGDGLHCTKLDGCNFEKHDCTGKHMRCVSKDGGIECACIEGYTMVDNHCKDLNECAIGMHNCTKPFMTCDNVDGGFECNCMDGYLMLENECQIRLIG